MCALEFQVGQARGLRLGGGFRSKQAADVRALYEQSRKLRCRGTSKQLSCEAKFTNIGMMTQQGCEGSFIKTARLLVARYAIMLQLQSC